MVWECVTKKVTFEQGLKKGRRGLADFWEPRVSRRREHAGKGPEATVTRRQRGSQWGWCAASWRRWANGSGDTMGALQATPRTLAYTLSDIGNHQKVLSRGNHLTCFKGSLRLLP